MPTPPGGWSPLWRDDWAQRNAAQESEFGTPVGYRDPKRYQGTIAGQTLPQALERGNPNDG